MKKRKKFSIKEEYKKSWKYLKETKVFILIIVAIFFIFALIGFFVPAPEILSNKIMNFIQQLIGQTSGMSQGELIRFIFLNNIQSSFYGLVLGVILGIFPIIVTISNGYLLGFVSSISVQNDGIFSLWRLFPHGIFELPAVFISLGLGLKFGTFIFQKKKLESFKEYLLNSLRIFLLIVIPLLIIAAIIEGSLIIFG